MHVECEKRDDYTLARVTGSIEVVSGNRLAEATCLRTASDHVVLDMSGVDFLDSSGVRILLDIVRNFKEAGKKIVMANPSPTVFRTLQLVSFDRLIPIAESVEAGIGALAD